MNISSVPTGLVDVFIPQAIIIPTRCDLLDLLQWIAWANEISKTYWDHDQLFWLDIQNKWAYLTPQFWHCRFLVNWWQYNSFSSANWVEAINNFPFNVSLASCLSYLTLWSSASVSGRGSGHCVELHCCDCAETSCVWAGNILKHSETNLCLYPTW